MCDKILRELDKSLHKSNEDYCSGIAKGNNLEDVKGYVAESVPRWPPPLSSCCPRASMYYAYAEDTNPFDRINEFTEANKKRPGDDLGKIHFDPPLDPFTIRDPYGDDCAREKYLRSDPCCFAIFGKPGLDSQRLAKLVSQSWNCVLISPESLIREEIEKKSNKGEWIADNLANGEAIEMSIVMNLVESRVKQRDVMHRGYVVEGLPLIPNESGLETSSPSDITSVEESSKQICTIHTCGTEPEVPSSQSQSSSSLESDDKSTSLLTLGSLKKTKNIGNRINIFHRTTVGEALPMGKLVAGILARINPFDADESRTKVPRPEKYQQYVPDQIKRIFETWPVKPTVIIYIVCPDEDAIVRRADFRFDPREGKIVDSRFFATVKNVFDDDHMEKYLLNPVFNSPTNVKFQCEIYKRHALPIIDRQILKHNPQNIIRVDGRTSASQMFLIISTKLRTLPISRIILPTRIREAEEIFDGEEVVEKPIEDTLDDRSNEEIFEEFANKSTISWRFPWCISKWRYDCPVELAKGRTVEGNAENVVRFMNKIFFLSSTEAMESFLENPRPFLLPFKPRPSCKIAIFGPKYAGKSKLSNAIGRRFGAIVIDVSELEKELIDDRINVNVADAARRAVKRVVADLKVKLEAERESREDARREALNFWLNEVKTIVEELDFDEAKQTTDHTISRKLLQEYGLQFLEENVELRERIKHDESVIYDYAPDNLRYEEPPIRELSEHDPEVAAILENEVKHLRTEKITITNSEIAGLLISRIKMTPDEPFDGGLLREPGWIVDGMHPDSEIWRFLAAAGVAFDHLILIIEKEPYQKLIRNWQRFQEREDTIEQDESYLGKERTNLDLSKMRDIESYVTDIKDFEEKWYTFATLLDKEPFVCDLDETPNVYESVSRHIEDRYRLAAKIMTEEEREREFEDTIESGTDVDDEEDLEDEELEASEKKQVLQDNRRLGDTGIYCPVALARSRVLRKGREEFSALYLGKIYLCSSAEALNDFVNEPEIFNVPFEKPISEIPAARIFIVGPPGSGKSSVAKLLAKEYNASHVDLSSNLEEYMRKRGIMLIEEKDDSQLRTIDLPLDLTDEKFNIDKDTILAFMQKYKNEGAPLPHKMFEECVFNYFKAPYDASVTIFESFPKCLEDAEIALENNAIPELVIELECSLEKTQERLLPGLLGSFAFKHEPKKNSMSEDNTEVEEKDEEEAEDPEETRERILQQIEESYQRKEQLLDEARSRMEEELIPWIKVDGEKDTTALLPVLRKILQPVIARGLSTLERTYEVDPETAESLLDCGYYLPSSFGRSCPVQMYEKKTPIQMYLPMVEQDEIHTVLHRCYVYFIGGSEALKSFKTDPLKYLRTDSCNPAIPARVSIIGPPKCGKSTLAERFGRAYGMRVITRGEALRWTIEKFAWTKTGSDIEASLRSGDKVTDELVVRAVEIYSIDPRSSAQGFVLDGFPMNREEFKAFALLNIRPMMVLNLQADQNFCLTSSTFDDEENIGKPPLYPPSLVSHRYEKWEEISPNYLSWLNKYAQNIVDIDATTSKWAVWRNANRQFCSKFADVKRYFREADYDKVHSLKNLAVSPYEFRIRQSHYEFYCPSCLHHDDSLISSGPPPDRRGVVQFREYFYWICPKHLEDFVRNPQACLPPQATGGGLTATLPTERPKMLDEEIDVEHPCWAKRLQKSGNCIVTYAESLPECKIVPGQRNLGVLYKDSLYLFCSPDCRQKFLARSSMYSKIEIESRSTSPTTELKNMPTLDFLKKTVADVIVKAVTAVAAARPKYPGMSPEISASVYIAIFLKVHNADCSLNEVGVYEEVARRMEARRQIVRVATRNITRKINPHVAILDNTN